MGILALVEQAVAKYGRDRAALAKAMGAKPDKGRSAGDVAGQAISDVRRKGRKHVPIWLADWALRETVEAPGEAERAVAMLVQAGLTPGQAEAVQTVVDGFLGQNLPAAKRGQDLAKKVRFYGGGMPATELASASGEERARLLRAAADAEKLLLDLQLEPSTPDHLKERSAQLADQLRRASPGLESEGLPDDALEDADGSGARPAIGSGGGKRG